MKWYQRRVHGESISELHISNMKVLISQTGVVCSALARPGSPPAGYAPAAPAYPDEPPKYAYSYSVQDDYTSNNYGANEDRDGYAKRKLLRCSSRWSSPEGYLHCKRRWRLCCRCHIRRRGSVPRGQALQPTSPSL